jgi:serine/threonine protein kinase
MPLKAATNLGNYAILAAMGAGGMGEVYRARDTRLERDIAVKGYRRCSRAIPSACSGAARIGIGWHRETGDYAASVAALLNAVP